MSIIWRFFSKEDVVRSSKTVIVVNICALKANGKFWFSIRLFLCKYYKNRTYSQFFLVSKKFETMKSESEQKREMDKESSKLEKSSIANRFSILYLYRNLIVIYGMDSIIEFLWMFVAVFLLISAMDHMKSSKSAIEISSTYGLVVYLTQTCCVGWLGSIIEFKSVLVLVIPRLRSWAPHSPVPLAWRVPVTLNMIHKMSGGLNQS